jgi:RHS repeat-associated protein
VQKTTSAGWRAYIPDASGNALAETTSSGWQVGYVYLGGQLLSQYRDSTTYFVHGDHLGSAHLLTKLDKSTHDSLDFLPFGEQIAGSTGTTHKFTADERNAESSLDHTWFRQYSSSLARWSSPDPAGLLAADPSNPQSWNGYAYVKNNPMSSVDPLGLNDCEQHADCENIGLGLGDFGQPGQDILGASNFWDGRPYIGIGGGSFGGPVTLATYLPPWSVVTDATTTEINIDGTFGPGDLLTTIIQSPGIGGGIDRVWWGAFFRDVRSNFWNHIAQGNRRDGEGFGACVSRNADETTFGATRPSSEQLSQPHPLPTRRGFKFFPTNRRSRELSTLRFTLVGLCFWRPVV